MAGRISPKNKSPRRKRKTESGDVIRVQNVGSGAAVAAGRGAKASVVKNDSLSSIAEWVMQISGKIDSLPGISQAEQEDLKQQIQKIGCEANKGSKVEIGRLEKLINTLSVMAPDIFDIVITTFASPLAGIGLVIKKIGDKAKLERANSQT